MIKNPPILKFKDNVFNTDGKIGQSILEELKQFPFSSKLSFVPLIKYWEGLINSDFLDEKVIAREVFNQLDKFPFFQRTY